MGLNFNKEFKFHPNSIHTFLQTTKTPLFQQDVYNFSFLFFCFSNYFLRIL
jgi:hypothetical protein